MAKDTEDALMIGHMWNCEHAFEFRCPRSWDALEASDDPGVRYCDECKESVTMCQTPEEFIRLGNLGQCVATPDASFPTLVSMSMLGRPSAEHVSKLEQEKAECFDWWSKCEELKPEFSPRAMGVIAEEHARWKKIDAAFVEPVESCGSEDE